MKTLFSHPRLWSARQRLLTFLGLPVAALALAFAAGSASSPPNIQAVALSADPLYATTSGDKPALALALSVEYPTVGAQYTTQNGATDNSYANTNEYLGYYDAEACYTYNNTPTETPVAPLTTSDYKRFVRQGAATNRMCSDGFSGNFLNWSTNSAIDMLRLALSGGDRSVDVDGLTILQRAYIPNGNPICMWNSSNFPPKQLQMNGGGGSAAKPYWGAVPQAMITAANGSDIFVANTLNKIFFGTSIGGSCGNTSSYSLSVIPQSTTSGGITSFSGPLPADASGSCAGENQTCSFTGAREVWYGANSSWKYTQASNGISCSNGTFGDPLVGTVKACYTRAANASSSTPTTGNGLNSDGFFYSRVQVCDKDPNGNLIDARDYAFCTKYPSGNYKPTGVIQTYSNQLRLAAFGYLLDQTNSGDGTTPPGRYGGVLRAPMTYVGPTTYDVNGIDNTPTGGNPAAEWNSQTGVFNVNPENDTTFGKSGVLTYLNQFGRTGVPGIYKIYDPVSELYYETLRYLQGLQPSTLAVQGITDDMKDGFPVSTTWVDPYANRPATGTYACLKSNIVVIGDINTHDGNRFPTVDTANNIPDLGYWTGVVDNFERGNNTNYTDGQGVVQSTGNPNPANGNPRSDAIIGYAYWAHMHDIRGSDWTTQPSMQRPGLRVKSFLFDVNEYGAGSIASNRQYNNQFFTAAKYGGYESDPANATSAPYNIHGNPFQQQDGGTNNNVWQNPTTPGEAGSYYLQSSARGVLSAFKDIFSRASSAARSIAGAAITSKQLTQASSTVYQAAFDTSNWSGDLFAFPLTVDPATNVVTLSTVATWSASTQLAQMPSPVTTRNIVVGNPGSTALPTATAFTWGALSTTLQGQLNQLSPTATPDGLGQARLDFLRGSNANEGAPFRQRNNKLLGDIINSSVVYSGAPSTTITSATYAGFQATYANRTPAVFVGANDGMLHAFNANTGVELFGYIPSWMGPKLSALTDPGYLANHQSYVDGPPVVAEAQVGSANNSTDWHTVLVSGTGAGGRGVFALDVTDPTAFSPSSAMWEFTADDDPDMGFVAGQPQILKLRTSASSAAPTYKWYAIVASGVDNYTKANSNGVYGSGNPAIFLLDLAHAAGTAWTQGTDYFKISFPVNPALALTHATGMLNFKAAISNDGTQVVTKIFAGDLHGNLWKLDFSTYGNANWDMAHLTGFTSATSNQPYPLFIAMDSMGNVQPITMAPSIVASTTNPNGIQVAFGTGKYLEVTDSASTAQNSFYVIYDNGPTTPDNTPPRSAVISDRGRLEPGTINTATGAITVPTFVWGRATSDGDATQRSGWYVDFANSGERQVSGATLSGNTLVFGSLIPGTSGNAAACGVSGGSGNQYIVNVDTGIGTTKVSTVGILGQPLVLDLASASYTVSDSTGRRTKTITSQVINQGSTGTSAASGAGGQQTRQIVAGRLSWRQINNYLNLKNSPP